MHRLHPPPFLWDLTYPDHSLSCLPFLQELDLFSFIREMGLFNNDDGCILNRSGRHSNGSPQPAILINGCQESHAACRLDDGHENVVVGHAALCTASADLDESGVSDMAAAVKVLLEGLGEDVNRDGLIKTPLRVARAFSFATKGYRQAAEDIVGGALFPEAGVEAGFGCGGGFGGMVVVRNIDLFSLCEACLLPFKVCCHVAYISSGLQVVGLSKLSRVADMFARRLQNPQRLAEEISQGLADTIRPLGVAVVVQSRHLPVPGVHDDDNFSRFRNDKNMCWHCLSACAGKGQFEDKSSDAWTEFLAILQLEGIVVDRPETADCNGSPKKNWCPCLPYDKDASGIDLTCNGSTGKGVYENRLFHSSLVFPAKSEVRVSAMINAVESILHALGEDGTKEELLLTPKRFVRWLLNFKQGHQDSDHVANNHDMNGTFVGMNGHSLRSSSKAESGVSMTRDASNGNSLLFELDAPFFSLCEHHLLPFCGIAHVGYFVTEAEEVIERSAVLRLVQVLSQRLQVQERLTKNIAEAIICRYNVQSIMVVLEASHICMVSRGVEKLGSSTATVAVTGRFATDVSAKAAFLKKISGRSVKRTWA